MAPGQAQWQPLAASGSQWQRGSFLLVFAVSGSRFSSSKCSSRFWQLFLVSPALPAGVRSCPGNGVLLRPAYRHKLVKQQSDDATVRRRWLPPKARTYVALASSFERSGRWQAVEALLAEMVQKQIAPDNKAHSLRISAYANARPKRVEDACRAFSELPRTHQTDLLVQAAMKRCLGPEAAIKLFRQVL